MIDVTLERVEIAQIATQRKTIAFAPTCGLRLVWNTPDYGYQLIEVDTRANGKVWVYGYLETEKRWFYQTLAEDAEITRAPAWAVFGADVDTDALKRMRDDQLHPERDVEFRRHAYRSDMGE